MLAAGTPYVIRQRMPIDGSTTFHDAVYGDITIENKELEDQVLLKSDGYPTYNFANVIDDHLMNITHVVRGCEYLSSTPKYNLLYEAFGWEIPTYVHLPLIMGKNEDGSVSKLSKRHGSTSFEGLIKEGYLPETIVNYIALLGWCPKDNREQFTLEELTREFSIDGISKSPAVFDYDKLEWFNGEHIHAMSAEQFIAHALPYFQQAFPNGGPSDWAILVGILQPRITKFIQIPGLLAFFSTLPDYPVDFFINKKSKTNLENSKDMLRAAIHALQGVADWKLDVLHALLLQLAQELGVKNGTLLWPARIAAAGTLVTPGGAMEILTLLGKEEALRRLQNGLDRLSQVG